MSICPHCNAQVEDGVSFCPACGKKIAVDAAPAAPAGTPEPAPAPNYYYPPAFDPADHTAEFDPQDISDNKVVCMLVYLSSFLGIIIALLIGKDSPYVNFHLRQALKFLVCEILLGLIAAVLAFTLIVPIAAGIAICVLAVIQLICFFQVCQGKAKEPAIIRSLSFLK